MLPWASDSNQRVHSPCSQCHRLLKPGLCSRHLARPASYYFNLLNPLEGSLWCARDLHARNNFMTSYQELKVSNPCLHPLLFFLPPFSFSPSFLLFFFQLPPSPVFPSRPSAAPPTFRIACLLEGYCRVMTGSLSPSGISVNAGGGRGDSLTDRLADKRTDIRCCQLHYNTSSTQ